MVEVITSGYGTRQFVTNAARKLESRIAWGGEEVALMVIVVAME